MYSAYNCYTIAPCASGWERGCVFCTRLKLIPGPGRGRCTADSMLLCYQLSIPLRLNNFYKKIK
ncbi:hypothetical protein HID58_045941 [Brassica napus]|uniref:Uncharacterized protein n=1 Tax=Brassica napus TaxID=3708 RepID=A0ABQ8AV63_BRANA|nr:hypothetical protein HID58_045941 [Brassica napus]